MTAKYYHHVFEDLDGICIVCKEPIPTNETESHKHPGNPLSVFDKNSIPLRGEKLEKVLDKQELERSKVDDAWKKLVNDRRLKLTS